MSDEPKWLKRLRGKYRNVKGKYAEKLVAWEIKGKRVGGPGKHDVIKKSAKIEVKNRENPVTRPELIRMKRKGVTQVVSKVGFTKPALEYAKRSRMKLYKGIIMRKRLV